MAAPAVTDRDRVRDWQDSGLVELTGHPDGPGIVPPGYAATWARWLAAGVHLDGARLLSERARLLGKRRAGRASLGGGSRLIVAADGWVAVSLARPDDPLLLAALVGRDLPDLGADVVSAVSDWAAHRSMTEIHDRAVLLGLAVAPVPEPVRGAVSAGWPLAAMLATPRSMGGVLVVDFSALWAGPLAAHLLGLGGARVVKIETPARPDGARRGDRRFYDLLHGGHESVSLDPTDPDQRRALHELVRRADIVIEGSRPRALAGWGLDAHAEAGRGATWVSITAAGRESDRVGFGDDIAAGAGLVALDATGDPVFVGDAVSDPLAGVAAAALAASVASVGRVVDLSMHDLVAATLHGPPDMMPPGPTRVATTDPLDRLAGPAPELGADTARVLDDLGIRWRR